MNSKFKDALVKISLPLIAIALSLVLGMLIIFALQLDLTEGVTNVKGYLWDGTLRAPAKVLAGMVPLIFVALAYAIALRCGIVNIGGEGQFIFGAFVASFFAVKVPLPSFILIPLVLLIGFIAGGLWASIASILKVTRGVNEIISTVLLNYIVIAIVEYLFGLGGPLQDPQSSSIGGVPYPDAVRLNEDFFVRINDGFRSTDFTIAFFIAILFLVIYYVFFFKTTKGYELRVTGYNKTAAEYSGMHVKSNILLSMFLSGGFAGLGGTIFSITVSTRYVYEPLKSYGFTGIAVALVGSNSALGIFFSSFFFSILTIAGDGLATVNGYNKAIVQVIQAFVILFVVGSGFFLEKYEKKQAIKNSKVVIQAQEEVGEENE